MICSFRLAVERLYAAMSSGSNVTLREPDPPFSTDFVVNDESEFLEPLYFVTHPDNSFSVANPQPSLAPDFEVRKQMLADIGQLLSERAMLKFLLGNAPMIDAIDPTLLTRGATAFAYINPKTFAKLSRGKIATGDYRFPPPPTRWLCTSLMPEDRVIFSPTALPGTEKRNEEHAVASRNARKPRR